MKPVIPFDSARLIDERGQLRREWRYFLAQLANQTGDAALAADLRALADRVAALEGDDDNLSALIVGLGSVRIYGTLESGKVEIRLDNDEQAPGVTFIYGTGPTGVRGWQRLYNAHEAGVGLEITDSGYLILGTQESPDDLPTTGNTGEAWRVSDPPGLYAWDGSAFTLDDEATGVVGYRLAANLDDLLDVSASSPSVGDALVWNGTAWVPDTVATEQVFNRIDTGGDIRVTADGSLRITD